MLSLKDDLTNLIKSYSPNMCPLQAVYDRARELGQKQKTAERRLNKSENGLVETIYNEKNHIIGYKYKGIIMPKIPIKLTEPKQETLCF